MFAKVIIDNISKNELIPEWGLAVYIEHEGHKFLLDTGSSDKFAKNAKELGIPLEEIEYGILSHAHYDHEDGMAAFFKINNKAKFYLRDGATENCYGKIWIFRKYIGIHKGFLQDYKERIVYASGDYELAPGVYLIGHKTPGLEKIGEKANLYIRKDGKMCPDDFAHEQSLVFDTPQGLVIFNSCSHGGADNIINEISATFPEKQIYAMIGGFHLYKSSEQEVRGLAQRIKDTGIRKIVTGHCTGQRAFDILKEELGEVAEQIYTGLEITVE